MDRFWKQTPVRSSLSAV